MAEKTKAKGKEEVPPKRLNRAVGAGEALGKVLDPALKKRGFASRDIITHWAAIVPAPYDRMARPDKLTWPRGEKGAEGAVLHLSCHPGHSLALAHEGQKVAAAVNRYFGYFLVGQVRLSATPFELSEKVPETVPALPEVTRARIGRTVDRVQDPGVREALRELGQAMARKKL
ncbi:DciA family protein [Devosia sp. ZB163]|uniref:DUF721 domain-containing protein n=1 Tax=Devosia sp. ZB163 TaxID=3025938 RepID=UPI0023621478|nr:DciA family protein [Devosia sp. ZB163]MDC9823652.1 DciA family protein [Devosia sp. ZB163]